MTSRELMIQKLGSYQSSDPGEIKFKAQFLDLLQHTRCFHRDFLPGHITGSAFIVDQQAEHVLLTHHAKLNKWLQPGGHADGDENVLRVALREAEEETGLRSFSIVDNENIFDIDIHTIPARKNFPEHLHFDIRVLLIADRSEPLQITEESHDLRWIPFNDLVAFANNDSLTRMLEKAKQII
jgi:8-oxo-dGTP pyrophosphatase MutT (NUDIX family)